MNLSETNASKPDGVETEKKLEITPDNEGVAKKEIPKNQSTPEKVEKDKTEISENNSEAAGLEIVEQSEEEKKEVIASIEEKDTTNSEETEVKEQITDTIIGKSDSSGKEETPAEKTDSSGEKENLGEKTDSSGEKENSTEKSLPELNVDYSNFSRKEILIAFKDLVSMHPVYKIRNDVDNIKIHFYKKLKADIEEKRKLFIDEGGKSEDFIMENDSMEDEFKTYQKRYKELKFDHNRSLDGLKKENLKIKYEIIDKISNLIYTEESINKTFSDFRELQKQWYDTGPVPQPELNRLWETYHHHVEKFYDYININKELKDLDLRKNHEEKEKLCLRAEALLKEQSPIKAFKELQKLHGLWRETGPVHREKKEDIWNRFKATTSIINKAHQHHYESIREGQKKNLDEKTRLCEQTEEILGVEINSHKDWDKRSKEIIKIQKIWKTIGFAPPKDNNKIYKRFRTACDDFFGNKREFYSKNKEIQTENLKFKTELCLKAEAYAESTDWKNTTTELINIQKEWKLVGPVARKHSDNVWKRFRKACDTFFERKSEHFLSMGGEQEKNLKIKLEIVKKINELQSTENHREDLKKLKLLQEEWKQIGHVPFKEKDKLMKEFGNAVDKVYSELKIDDSSKNLLKFRQKIEQFNIIKRGDSKLYYEREKLANKLKQAESDIVVWDNNIGFFTKSKSSEAMINDFKIKIEKGKKNIEILKSKIRIIDNFESSKR